MDNIGFSVAALVVFLALAAPGSAGARDMETTAEARSVGWVQVADARSEAADRFFLKAVKLYRAGDFNGAVKQFELGLSINPDNPVAHYYFAETLSALKRHAEATRHYEKAVETAPGTTEGIMAAAILSRQKKERETLGGGSGRKVPPKDVVVTEADIKTCNDYSAPPKDKIRTCTPIIQKYADVPETNLMSVIGALATRSGALWQTDRCAGAIADLKKEREIILAVMEKDPRTGKSLKGWLDGATIGLSNYLATSPHSVCRSGNESIRLAKEYFKANEHHFAEFSQMEMVARSHLALAYAEAGKIDLAVTEQERALKLIAKDNKFMLNQLEAGLELLQRANPIRLCPNPANKYWPEICDEID